MGLLRIENLGPIKKLEIEIKQFNLFIGEQASGKSTICKTVFFFREFKQCLIEYLYNISVNGVGESQFPKALNRQMKDTFVQLFGYSWHLPANLSAEFYYTQDFWINVRLKQAKDGKRYLSLGYSNQIKNEVKKLEQEAQKNYNSLKLYDSISIFTLNERSRFHSEIEKKVNTLLDDDKTTYYIPAGRGLLSLMTNQKTRVDYDMIDLVNRRFMQFIETIQPRFDGGVSEVYKYYPVEERKFDVHRLSEQIIRSMKGEYIYSKGREYLREQRSNEQILINFASSGQQELLWLLNQLYVLLLRNEKSFVIIEEPEAHVYPLLQREVLEFIVEFMNYTGSTVIVTTHSPYILTSMNNLYVGGRLVEHNPEAKLRVEKILGKGKYIRPANLQAYKLRSEKDVTKAESLLSDDSEDIDAGLIDDVSEKINRHYTELFYLEEEYGDKAER